jgi:hypothetical protein
LIGMMTATVLIASLPASYGVIGYLLPLVILTASYASFQAANNTAIMSNVSTDQKGVVSGLLSLARNLGLITGVSAMGAVFAITSGAPDIAVANQYAIVMGMHWTFTVAAILIGLALALAYWRQRK